MYVRARRRQKLGTVPPSQAHTCTVDITKVSFAGPVSDISLMKEEKTGALGLSQLLLTSERLAPEAVVAIAKTSRCYAIRTQNDGDTCIQPLDLRTPFVAPRFPRKLVKYGAF